MSTAAFCELVKGILRLPASKSVDKMMIELRFEYSLVFRNAKLPPSISLADAGIGDSDELELAISTEWVDKLRIRQSIRLPDISHLGPTEKSSLTDLSELTNLLSGFLDNRNSGITRLQSFERSHGEITQEKVDRSAARYFTYLDSSSKV